MRVAVAGPFPLPGRPPTGGVEAVAAALVRGLRAAGVEVAVVTCSPEVGRVTALDAGGADLWAIPTSVGRGRATLYARERALIRRLLRRIAPDVVHVQGQNFYGPAALGAGFPAVATLHGLHFREAAITDGASGLRERLGKLARGWVNARFERQTLRRARDLVIISPYVLEAIRPLTRARAHPIPNPIDETFFAVPRRPVPGRVLFVGVVEPRKEALPLVRAFAAVRRRLPGATLHLVGRVGDPGYGRAVARAIDEEGLGGAARHLGVIPHGALLDEYAAASALVLPSREESSPMAIQQAMAAGVPVVASRAAGIPYLVRDGETGLLVPPGDGAALAGALVRVLGDRALQARLAGGARAAAAAFGPAAVAARTVEVYRQAIAAARPRPVAPGVAPEAAAQGSGP